MRYIVTRRFRCNAICGPVNLPYGTTCEEHDGILVLEDGRKLCANTSQNAYDYFSRDDDGMGLERGKLVQAIRSTLERRDVKYQARWDRLWADEGANKLRRTEHEDYWLWSFAFYNADVNELRRIRRLLEG